MWRNRVLVPVLAVLLVVSTAESAAADSSACTHHFSGPQICIRLEGRNSWNTVIGFWVNPPKKMKSRPVSLYWNGKHFNTSRATRVGKTLSHKWSSLQTGTNTKLCVKFKGSQRMACQHTRWVGNRVSS